MRSFIRKSFVLFIAFLLSIQSIAAITDIFHNPDGPDRGSFFMRIQDSLNNKKISNRQRKITIQLFFLSKFYDEINDVKRIDLSAAFNRSLRTKALLRKTKEELQATEQAIKFTYKSISSEDRSKKYNRISFESESVIISDSQRINFNFDQKGFADYLDVSIDDSSNYQKRVRYAPLSTEDLESFNAELNNGIVMISGVFSSNKELDLNNISYSFKFANKSKKHKAIAQLKKNNLRLEVELVETNPAIITQSTEDESEYEINIPIKLSTKRKMDLKKYKSDKTYEVEIPVLIELNSSSGLEFELKGLVKQELSNFLSSSD